MAEYNLRLRIFDSIVDRDSKVRPVDKTVIIQMANRVRTLCASGDASRPGPVLVGIFGPPGSGKSTTAQGLVSFLSHDGVPAAYVPMDGFHLSNAQLDRLGRRERKGAPDTFDASGYVDLLARLMRAAGEGLGSVSQDIYVPDYSRELHEPVAAARVVPAGTRVIITEGNYLGRTDGAWATVRELVNELWYLDASDSELERRLLSRRLSFGDIESNARSWITTVDMPNVRSVRATMRAADVSFVDN